MSNIKGVKHGPYKPRDIIGSRHTAVLIQIRRHRGAQGDNRNLSTYDLDYDEVYEVVVAALTQAIALKKKTKG